MKNLTKYVTVFVIVFLVASPSAFAAQTSTSPISISATVAPAIALNVVLKQNSSTGATVTAMNFGKLVDIGTGTLRSSPTSTTATGSVVAMVAVNGQGTSLTLTQAGTSLTGTAGTLPTGACTVVSQYVAADNGGSAIPSGAVANYKGTWLTTHTLYTDPTGSARTIQASYSVTDDPAAGATTGVPLSQAAGTYAGTVTFTLTA